MTSLRTVPAAALLLLAAVFATPTGAGAEPVAAFVIQPDSGGAPLQVSLLNESGDGQESDQAAPSHLYDDPGLYLVTLQACDADADADACTEAGAIVNVAGDDAADAGPITSGERLVGSIDPAGDTDLWTFVAAAGGRATITMSPEPGSLIDPILRLFGPSGALVAFNDDAVSGTDPSATISDVVLDDPGTYTVEATAFLATTGVYRLQLDVVDPAAPWARFEIAPASGVAPLTVATINDSANATSFVWNFGDGDTSTVAAPEHTFTDAGAFVVTLTACSGVVCDTASATISVETDDGGPIAPGESRSNRIDFADDIDSYTFDAPAGAEITIDLTSLTFDALLFLRGPDGDLIFTDDDGGEGRNARIAALVLHESGTYVIEAQAFPDAGLGEYGLSLELDPEPVIRARAGADVPALVAPVEVRFSDRSLGGPTSWSWTLDGNLLSREPRFTHRFEQPGSFVVSLEACNVRSWDTWRFQLALGLDNDGGPIASRGTALAQIAPPGDHDDWQVSGVAGGTLSATALADDSSLDLTLELIDPDGASIAFDDDGAGDLNPRIVLALPRSGTYTLRIAAFDGTLGGGYRLEVDLRAPAGTSG